jgi:hypothetical protein
MTGSSNFPPLLQKLAPIIIDQTGLTPVFLITNSCAGVRSMHPTPTFDMDHYIHDPVTSSDRFAEYFTAEGTRVKCMLNSMKTEVDVGESETFPETCGIAPDTEKVREFPGPILPIVFVVPDKSDARAISAKAAKQVFGGTRAAKPWTNPSLYYVRNPGTATQALVGRAIELDANKFWGVDQGTAQDLAAHLEEVRDPVLAQQAIGILGADFFDIRRLNLKALAFQANGQECAYLPDSNSNVAGARDKINVRDGHYPIWGPLHFFAAISEGTALVSQAAEQFVQLMTLSPIPDRLLDAFIESSFVPECAMKVQRRSTDLEAPTPFYTREPCGCYFETHASADRKPPSACKPCTSSRECTDGSRPFCSFHYCEAAPPP